MRAADAQGAKNALCIIALHVQTGYRFDEVISFMLIVVVAILLARAVNTGTRTREGGGR